MLVTLDTSHMDITLVAPGTVTPRNNQLMSVTADTFQDPIGPYGPLEQSEDSCKHSVMAAWSSALDLGVHPGVGYYCWVTWLNFGLGL